MPAFDVFARRFDHGRYVHFTGEVIVELRSYLAAGMGN
jgi:hypothetical protein